MGKKWPMPDGMADAVKARDGGCCVVCGLPVLGRGHIHHRKPRGMGGSGEANVLSNVLLLHPTCHLDFVEKHREKSQANGWLLQRWQEPEASPLLYMLNCWARLTNDGTIINITRESEGNE